MDKRLLVILISPSHHLVTEPEFFTEPYIISENNFENEIDKVSRQFSLKYKVELSNVSHLLTYRIK